MSGRKKRTMRSDAFEAILSTALRGHRVMLFGLVTECALKNTSQQKVSTAAPSLHCNSSYHRSAARDLAILYSPFACCSG